MEFSVALPIFKHAYLVLDRPGLPSMPTHIKNFMDKFLLAENPMALEENLSVIHTTEPVAIIECIAGHTYCTTPYRQYSFTNIAGDQEDWTLRIHHCQTGEAKNQLMLYTLLDDAWIWYQRYMNWEDSNSKLGE